MWGRVGHNENFYAEEVSKVHKVWFADMMSAGANSTVAIEDDGHFCIRVEPIHVSVLNVLAYEPGCVAPSAYWEIRSLHAKNRNPLTPLRVKNCILPFVPPKLIREEIKS